MVPSVGSLPLWYRQLAPCLFATGSWLHVSLVPSVGFMCLYDVGSWLPFSLSYRHLAACVSVVPEVSSLCL